LRRTFSKHGVAAKSRKPRVLLAVTPGAAERMGRILEGWEIERPQSLPAFVEALHSGSYDAVVVGHFFDDSRAIEALAAARQDAPRAPLVCVRAVPFSCALGDAAISAFQAAAQQLGARCFIDVLQFADNPEGNGRVRSIVERAAALG
jgi:hypothetical protein